MIGKIKDFTINPETLLKVGDYVDVFHENGKTVVKKEGNEIGSLDINPFSLRQKLKGVIKQIENNECEVQVLKYVDLHRHSAFSLLDGATKIPDLVEKTPYAGAITDHGNMYGFFTYYTQMKKAGKQPIIGMEAYCEDLEIQPESRHKRPEVMKLNRNHLILLAKNEAGVKNLYQLTSLSQNYFYKKPHVTYELLKTYNEGIIALSACLGGAIPRAILKENIDLAHRLIENFKSIYGEDFYIEIQRHELEAEKIVNPILIELAKEHGVKIVATTDSHYPNVDDAEMHELLLCMQTSTTMQNKNHKKFDGTGYHIHTEEEMERKFCDLPEALDTTLEIAEKCKDIYVPNGVLYMPEFPIPDGFKSDDDYFKHLVMTGYEDRFKDTEKFSDPVYQERIEYEVNMIIQMGFSSYFIIVWDFINFAKTNDIKVGPGRGSAVGSLVSYCLKITDLDPIPLDLLFERFLNPERVSMPDIDIDMQDDRRDEVIKYVKDKYGEESVCGVLTLGSLAAKASIRDIARVMDYSVAFGDRIAKMIPNEVKMTLDKAEKANPDLGNLIKTDPDVRKVYHMAKKVEGLFKNASQHACAVVIAPKEIRYFLPTTFLAKEKLVDGSMSGEKSLTTQVLKEEVETLGLVKMDFLGLKTMTVLDYVEKSSGVKNDDINIYDPYIYLEISKGNNLGVFQLESAGMTNFMQKLYSDVARRVEVVEKKYGLKGFLGMESHVEYIKELEILGKEFFERIIAGVALYRPGPMDYIDQYIEGMMHPELIHYDDPKLIPILSKTYGVIVFQEQVQQIVQSLAGYSLGRGDEIRRAMGKKKEDVMKREENIFIYGNESTKKEDEKLVQGCINNGITEEAAKTIWSKMADFAKYAFNKSHAAAYGFLAVKTAFYKLYYPELFVVANLNSYIEKADKLKGYLNAARKIGVKISPPDINISIDKFSYVDNKIVFGFEGLVNINKTACLIEKERDKNGPFLNFSDFINRMLNYDKINKIFFIRLIEAGALDCFEGTRRGKIAFIEKELEKIKNNKKKQNEDQLSLLDLFQTEKSKESFDYKPKNLEEFSPYEFSQREFEACGMYITGHPILFYSDKLQELNAKKVFEIKELEESNEEVLVGVLIKETRKLYTKASNELMYSIKAEDETGEINCIVFPKEVEEIIDLIYEGKRVVIRGNVSYNEVYGHQIIVKNMIDIEERDLYEPKDIQLTITEEDQIETIYSYLETDGIPVYMRYKNEYVTFKDKSKGIVYSRKNLEKLHRLLGVKNVVLNYNL